MNALLANKSVWIALIVVVCLVLVFVFGADRTSQAISAAVTLGLTVWAAISATRAQTANEQSQNAALSARSASVAAGANAEEAKSHALAIKRNSASGNGSNSTPSLNSLACLLLPLLMIGAMAFVGGCSSVNANGQPYPVGIQGTNEQIADALESGYLDAVTATEAAYAVGAISDQQFKAAQALEIAAKIIIDRARAAAYANDPAAQQLLGQAGLQLQSIKIQRDSMKAQTLKARVGSDGATERRSDEGK